VKLPRPWTLLQSRPRLWLLLLLWPILVLLLILTPMGLYHCASTAIGAALSVVVASAVTALVLLALIARRFYWGVRDIRNKLFEGDYETALDLARRNAAVGLGGGFASALERMLEFDRRRAEKVAASARLFTSLLREAPAAFFVADLEEDLIHFSRAARELFGVNADRFSILSLLLLPANREFARLYSSVAHGERARADATVTIRLPVRQATREVELSLLAVQDDEGLILYVLGLLGAPAVHVPQPTEVVEL